MNKEKIMILLGKLMFTLNGTELLTEITDALNELLEYKQIDNAKPSEAIKQLGDISYFIMEAYSDHEPLKDNQKESKQCFMNYFSNIKQALIKAQELKSENSALLEENKDLYVELAFAEKQYKELTEGVKKQSKVLRVIKEKDIDIGLLKRSENWLDYYTRFKHRTGKNTELTQEEFDLLKAYFEKNIQK